MATKCECDACDGDDALSGERYCFFCLRRCSRIASAETGQPTRALGFLLRYGLHREAAVRAEARELEIPWGAAARGVARWEAGRPPVAAPELELPTYRDPRSPEDHARIASYLRVVRWDEDPATGDKVPVYLGYHADDMPPGGPVADLPTCGTCGAIAARCPCPPGQPIDNTFHRWPAAVPHRDPGPALAPDALATWWRGVIGARQAPEVRPEDVVADSPSRASKPPTKDRSMIAPDLLVVDCETTGLSPQRHHLLEVAAARLTPDASECRGRFAARILLPERAEVDERALAVNGYAPFSREWYQTAKPLAEVMARFKQLAAGRPVLVAHSAKFDRDFLRAGFARAGIPAPSLGGMLCTKALAASLAAAAGLPGTKLDQLAAHFGAVGRAHSAAGDVCRLVQVFWALKQLEREHAGRQAALFAEGCAR